MQTKGVSDIQNFRPLALHSRAKTSTGSTVNFSFRIHFLQQQQERLLKENERLERQQDVNNKNLIRLSKEIDRLMRVNTLKILDKKIQRLGGKNWETITLGY